MRHLLTHTSGIDGDVFTDTGRGDDCLEKYVALLSPSRSRTIRSAPPGPTATPASCSPAGSSRRSPGSPGTPRCGSKIYAPLGLTHTVTLPEEALLFRTAAGHVDVSAEPVLAPVWAAALPRAGRADHAPPRRRPRVRPDAPDRRPRRRRHPRAVAASAAAMTEFQADVPDKYTLGDSWGIGWIRFGWDGHRLVGHDGNTIGQAAFLRSCPTGLAVTLLTNGGNTRDLYEDLYREIFAELAGVAMPTPITPPAEPVETDITPHLGRYERAGVPHGDPGVRRRDRRAGAADHGHRAARRAHPRTGPRPTRCTRSGRTCT
jgi:CubicO group peptidase (beta-lactamase class C family)